MNYGNVPGISKPISRLVQGTMMLSTKDIENSFALLDAVLEMGGNCFDTAHVYQGGDCERALGRWIQDRGVRDRVVIIGKGAHTNQDRRRVTPFDIASDMHDSLARMKVDYIDLYLLHRDDPDAPVGPIVEALNEHLRAGRIHAFGGSNWGYERIIEANRYAQEHGLVGFAASSPQFSLADQLKEPWGGCISISGPRNEAARRFYQETQLAVFPWSSLAGGFFSGRIRRDNLESSDEYYFKLAVQCYASEENFQRIDRAEDLASRKGVTLPQIALAWVLNQPLNLFPLVGCRKPDEYRANALAQDIRLTPQELAYLDLRADTPA